MSRVFEEEGFQVIKRDLFTLNEKHDYLISNDSEYDVLITNPPFVYVREFLFKAFNTGKPFIMLIDINLLSTKAGFQLINAFQYSVEIVVPTPEFFHNGKWTKCISSCAWLFGNHTYYETNGDKNLHFMPTWQSNFKLSQIKNYRDLYSQPNTQEYEYDNFDLSELGATLPTEAQCELQDEKEKIVEVEAATPVFFVCAECGHTEHNDESYECCDKKNTEWCLDVFFN